MIQSIKERKSKSSMTSKQSYNLSNLVGQAQINEGYPIFLNVYHLTKFNYLIQLSGIGFFHTTIEVNNIEYSFGRTIDENSGVFFNKFGEGSKSIELKEKIYLGNTIYNDVIIQKLLILYIPYWLGKSYDPFLKNCNHFTKFLAQKLLRTNYVKNYPEYVNRIIEFGIFLSGYYSPIKRLYGKMVFLPNKGNSKTIDEEKYSQEKEKEKNNDNNKVIFEEDINIEIDQHSNYSKSSSKDNNNNPQISRQSLILKPYNESAFFESVMDGNFFLNPINNNEKSSNPIINKLSEADVLLNKKNYLQALKLYNSLLLEIKNEESTPFEHTKFYNIKETYPNIKTLAFNEIIKLKILHCIHYIYYKEDNIKGEENSCHSILLLNNEDYYGIFNFSYIKFRQNKFPECEKILQKALKGCKDEKFINYFSFFLKILDSLEL